MKINSLLKYIGFGSVNYNHEITIISSNSKECIPNCIYVAVSNNIDYINQAIENGAKSIITNIEYSNEVVNVIYSDNPKKELADLLYYFHKDIFKNLVIIGVIGTNGKTTTATLIQEYLNYTDNNAMLIGSNGCCYNNQTITHNNTTPDAYTLYGYFNLAYNLKIRYIVMEISSIAVAELRIRRIPFDVLVFTNFSEDHLDYHKTMENYLFNKCIPFYSLNHNSYVIANKDDNSYKDIIKHTIANVISYSLECESDICPNLLQIDNDGSIIELDSIEYKTKLIGKFNIYNILPLFGITKIFKLNNKELLSFINSFSFVPGRMNKYKIGNKNIIIDYAHTPEAVRNVIEEVNKITTNNIYVVIGCGGNREKEKRMIIGRILYEQRCIPILTSDNPRYEKPMSIINDIDAGGYFTFTCVVDRRKAIYYALNKMKDNDYLLILGKGVENYIEENGVKIPYSDYQVIEDYRNGI